MPRCAPNARTTDGVKAGARASPSSSVSTRPVPSPTTATRAAGRPACRQACRNTLAASGEVMHTQSKSSCRSTSASRSLRRTQRGRGIRAENTRGGRAKGATAERRVRRRLRHALVATPDETSERRRQRRLSPIRAGGGLDEGHFQAAHPPGLQRRQQLPVLPGLSGEDDLGRSPGGGTTRGTRLGARLGGRGLLLLGACEGRSGRAPVRVSRPKQPPSMRLAPQAPERAGPASSPAAPPGAAAHRARRPRDGG